MPLSSSHAWQRLGTKFTACLTIFALQISSLTPAWAALSQKPLLTSTDNTPKPNVMLTLDTSGSMNFRHMPETSAKITVGATTYDIPMGGSLVWLHIAGDNYYDMKPTSRSQGNYGGIMSADKNLGANTEALKTQIYFRSPDINSIYYNPRERYLPWAKADGTRYAEASTLKAGVVDISAVPVDPRNFKGTTVDLQTTQLDSQNKPVFWPGIYYLLDFHTSANPTDTNNYTLIDVNDPKFFPIQKIKDSNGKSKRSDCANADTCTQAEERANFANWFTYYRTRILLTKAALSETFYQIDEIARLGWTTLRWARQNPTNGILQRLQPLTVGHRSKFITDLQTTEPFLAGDSTPLRRALITVGQYFQDATINGPWNDNLSPAASDAKKASACRRSFNIMTTDGYYNNDALSRDERVGNADSGKGKPLEDAYSDTLADFAYKYWATDLQSTIDNKLTASTKDSATWQHLTQFTVSIGVTGTLNPNTDLPALTAGTKAWPNPNPESITLTPEAKIDDLWHAAVNSGGAYYSVKNSADLKAAFNSALKSTNITPRKEGGVALAGTTIQVGTRKYIPKYVQSDWSGDLEAYILDATGAVVDANLSTPAIDPAWRASDKLPATRNLITAAPSGGSPIRTQGVSFTWGTMGSANQAAMTAEGSASLVDYIRGSAENEGSSDDQFRVRTSKLGDFVDAQPVFVRDGINLRYGNLPAGGTTYGDFLSTKRSRTEGVVFLGGNDGFLHGFRDTAARSPIAETDGIEVLGYVPRGALPNLYKLAKQNYGLVGSTNEHQFFVDGQLIESDAYLSDSWHNVLVGSLGAGGKGLYALDVTSLSNLGTNSVLWDATLPDGNTPDVGSILSAPSVGPLPGGSWKVLVGNGYDSASNKAALLVYDLTNGENSSIPLAGDTTKPNGLGGLTVVRNTNQEIIGAYAGDLQGNLWRFEYRGGQLAVGYGGTPVFKAGDTHPITAAPAIIPNPAGGSMIVFGTGKLLDASDQTDLSTTQSIYGIWDPKPMTDDTSAALASTNVSDARTTKLVQQTVTKSDQTVGGYTLYNVSANAQTAGKLGWYLDLTIDPQGLRVIYPTQVIGTDYALISTVAPGNSASVDECTIASGKGINFVLPAVSGAQTDTVLDYNNDGLFDSKDTLAAAYETLNDGSDSIQPTDPVCSVDCPRPPRCPDGSIIQSTSGGLPFCPKPPWVVKDRVWKRLVNHP